MNEKHIDHFKAQIGMDIFDMWNRSGKDQYHFAIIVVLLKRGQEWWFFKFKNKVVFKSPAFEHQESLQIQMGNGKIIIAIRSFSCKAWLLKCDVFVKS